MLQVPVQELIPDHVQLVKEMATIIGTEASALGVNQLFAPLADLAREPRYGRVEETNSEDPYLAGEIAYAYVKGLQKTKVAATVKHFVGFNSPEQGLNTGPCTWWREGDAYYVSYKNSFLG